MRNWMARQVAVLRAGKSGRGLPQSKTWRRLERHGWCVSVLECASLLALFLLLPTASAQATNDVPPLRPALPEIPPTLWEQHGAWIVVLSILGVGLLGAALWWLFQPKPPVPVPIEIQTRQKLEQLQTQTEDGKTISQISQVLKRYIAVAFELPAGEMTTTEFSRAAAGSEKVGNDLAARVGDFLRQCDERKFSPTRAVQTSAGARALELFQAGEARRATVAQKTPA
jgi:hypothetical protein